MRRFQHYCYQCGESWISLYEYPEKCKYCGAYTFDLPLDEVKWRNNMVSNRGNKPGWRDLQSAVDQSDYQSYLIRTLSRGLLVRLHRILIMRSAALRSASD